MTKINYISKLYAIINKHDSACKMWLGMIKSFGSLFSQALPHNYTSSKTHSYILFNLWKKKKLGDCLTCYAEVKDGVMLTTCVDCSWSENLIAVTNNFLYEIVLHEVKIAPALVTYC